MMQKKFINDVLIIEIGDVVNNHPYLSFVLIVSGIELLGKCIETPLKEFNASLSKTRFLDAIDKLFPPRYKSCFVDSADNLYVELRCGMSHSLLPKSKISLSEKRHGLEHLSISDGQLILVAEDFYKDFKIACEKVIAKIDAGEITSRFSLKVD